MCELTRLTALRCLSISANLPHAAEPLKFWAVGWWQLPPRLTSLGLTGFNLAKARPEPSDDDAERCGAALS